MCIGKGRKERTTPLKAETATALTTWLHERQGDDPTTHCSPPDKDDRSAATPSRCCVTKHAHTAAASCPSLATKHVTPHTLRHTNAMLLQAEHVDIATIALWLGHESIKTTYVYQHADNALKQQAIDRTATIGTPLGRYQPPDRLLAFLESL